MNTPVINTPANDIVDNKTPEILHKSIKHLCELGLIAREDVIVRDAIQTLQDDFLQITNSDEYGESQSGITAEQSLRELKTNEIFLDCLHNRAKMIPATTAIGALYQATLLNTTLLNLRESLVVCASEPSDSLERELLQAEVIVGSIIGFIEHNYNLNCSALFGRDVYNYRHNPLFALSHIDEFEAV